MRLAKKFENIVCRRCRVAYPARRRMCPCCNEYNPAYIADPTGPFDNRDDPEPGQAVGFALSNPRPRWVAPFHERNTEEFECHY